MAPVCHPERRHQAKGLCMACYARLRRGVITTPARRYNVMPEFDPWSRIPARVPGVEQHAVTSFPLPGCPKCGNPRLIYSGREAYCAGHLAGCGMITYLVHEPEPEPQLQEATS